MTTVSAEIDPPLPSKTTSQEDLVTAGQRKINLIWEFTQSGISILITLAMIYLAITVKVNETMTNAFFLIVGFYFSRTNHSAIGGTGDKPSSIYMGR